jgi:hypothetical protein
MFDDERLPTYPVVSVIAAMAHQFPQQDALGKSRRLHAFYVWRAAFTRRYESASATRAYQDYLALRDAIRANTPLERVGAPIFNETVYPMPAEDVLVRARWPRSRDSLARGILALALAEGGLDIADGTPANAATVKHREYHHIFPDSTLAKIGGLEPPESYRALNCALVTWRTNRHISNRSPLEYLSDRVAASHLGEPEIRTRLESHLIPWEQVKASGPYDDESQRSQLNSDYENFLAVRARLVAARARERAGAGLVGIAVFDVPRTDETDAPTRPDCDA